MNAQQNTANISQGVYDHNLANQAAAIDQCIKLGGVIIEPGKPTTGFAPPRPPRQP